MFCYSSDLELLWKVKLLDSSTDLENYKVKALGAMVTSHSVSKNDEGLVIVGGSFTHKNHKQILQSEW